MSEARKPPYCPKCTPRHLLNSTAAGPAVDVCPRCAGLWCQPNDWDPDSLGRYPKQPAEDGSDIEVGKRTRLHCPEGHGNLTSLLVKGVVGMEIDQCGVCEGIWFDHREWDYLDALRVWERHRREEDQPTTWGHWWFQLLLNLPVEFNIRPHQYALVTLSTIALCAVVYFVGGFQLASLLALWPNQLWSGIGAVELLTYQFVHVSPFHLFGNMYFLYILGDNVEDVLGPVRFLLLYLACGVLAALVQTFAGLDPRIPLMGASGSIAGLMGAYLLLFRGARLTLMVIVKQFKAPAWVWIGLWVGIQLLGSWTDPSGLRSHVAWLAHVGGFASGIVLVWPFRRTLTERHAVLHLLETGRLVA